MKFYLIICSYFILFSCQNDGLQVYKNPLKKDTIFWNTKNANKHLLNQNDKSKWDTEAFDYDLGELNQVDSSSHPACPVYKGVFPVPDYDYIGKESFKGIGFYNGERYFHDKKFCFNNFFVNKNIINAPYLGSKKSEVFFTIIALTDYLDTINFSHRYSEIISRNHPNYIGQGTFVLKDNKIEYIAFITGDRNSYALVNMRLFELRFGNVIVIAPQKDRSFRSLQINEPIIESKDIEKNIDRLLNSEKIRIFFSANGNI